MEHPPTNMSLHPPILLDRPASKGQGTWRPLYAHIRFQLPVGLLICVALPAYLRVHDFVPAFLNWRVLLPQNAYIALYNGAVGASIAIIAGFFLMRRLAEFPGFKATTSIFTAYTVPFAAVVAAFFIFRFDYSRFVFTASYCLAIPWFMAMHALSERVRSRVILLIPGGQALRLVSLGAVSWITPAAPPQSTAGISAVAADLGHNHAEEWQHFLCDCALASIPVFHHKQLEESMTGKVDIQHLSENTFGSVLPNMVYLRVKYLVDFAISLMALPLFLLLLLIVGPMILISSGWPVFFRQERIGFGGRVFEIVKFRTMVPGLSSRPLREAAALGGRDKKITAIGQWLRRYRIDEMPQIINILRGEMSWIGPRPEELTLSKWYEAELPFYRYRHTVRPGITGWAQVNQGHVARPEEVLEKLHYDFYYIKHISPSLDLLIVLQTIRTILSGFGSR